MSRFRRIFAGADLKVCMAFWLFGLLNNLQFTLTLCGALDIAGPLLPKSLILLANVIPSLASKSLFSFLLLPLIPYHILLPILSSLCVVGMFLVAYAASLSTRLVGIALTSAASGVVEVAFLGMTHYYGRFGVAFWGSGTGLAGLVGAGVYNVLTSGLGWTAREVLMAGSVVPIGIIVTYWTVLPKADEERERRGYRSVVAAEEVDERQDSMERAEDSLGVLEAPQPCPSRTRHRLRTRHSLRQTARIFFPYMLPLALVYISEYTINQGVAPTLLFPLSSTPFSHFREIYPFYNLLYQVGVFISRSSTPWFRLHELYIPAVFQVFNLLLLILQSRTNFIPSIWVIFSIIFWEGLLGGAAYVNTFEEMMEKVERGEREFSLGVVSVSDTAGICVAGLVSLWLEPKLCQGQVERGMGWCRQM